MGALTNRVVLVSRRPGFCFGGGGIFVWVGSVLGDDHSLMGGSDDAWSGGLLDYLDDQYHFVCPVCVPPWTWGFFVCFCAL